MTCWRSAVRRIPVRNPAIRNRVNPPSATRCPASFVPVLQQHGDEHRDHQEQDERQNAVPENVFGYRADDGLLAGARVHQDHVLHLADVRSQIVAEGGVLAREQLLTQEPEVLLCRVVGQQAVFDLGEQPIVEVHRLHVEIALLGVAAERLLQVDDPRLCGLDLVGQRQDDAAGDGFDGCPGQGFELRQLCRLLLQVERQPGPVVLDLGGVTRGASPGTPSNGYGSS